MSVFCRKRENINFDRDYSRYVNMRSEVVDGKVKHIPSPVVAPSLAAETSISMNVLRGSRSQLRSRKNVDAVDLFNELDKIK